jgi:uncharacterized short protein YbdD (DUF466 family)
MNATAASVRQQSIEQSSVQELNMIYFSDYVEQMMETNPERLVWEIREFQKQFSEKN